MYTIGSCTIELNELAITFVGDGTWEIFQPTSNYEVRMMKMLPLEKIHTNISVWLSLIGSHRYSLSTQRWTRTPIPSHVPSDNWFPEFCPIKQHTQPLSTRSTCRLVYTCYRRPITLSACNHPHTSLIDVTNNTPSNWSKLLLQSNCFMTFLFFCSVIGWAWSSCTVSWMFIGPS